MAAAPRPPSPKSLVKSLQRINVSINSDLARLPRRDVSPFQQQVTDLKDSEINNDNNKNNNNNNNNNSTYHDTTNENKESKSNQNIARKPPIGIRNIKKHNNNSNTNLSKKKNISSLFITSGSEDDNSLMYDSIFASNSNIGSSKALDKAQEKLNKKQSKHVNIDSRVEEDFNKMGPLNPIVSSTLIGQEFVDPTSLFDDSVLSSSVANASFGNDRMSSILLKKIKSSSKKKRFSLIEKRFGTTKHVHQPTRTQKQLLHDLTPKWQRPVVKKKKKRKMKASKFNKTKVNISSTRQALQELSANGYKLTGGSRSEWDMELLKPLQNIDEGKTFSSSSRNRRRSRKNKGITSRNSRQKKKKSSSLKMKSRGLHRIDNNINENIKNTSYEFKKSSSTSSINSNSSRSRRRTRTKSSSSRRKKNAKSVSLSRKSNNNNTFLTALPSPRIRSKANKRERIGSSNLRRTIRSSKSMNNLENERQKNSSLTSKRSKRTDRRQRIKSSRSNLSKSVSSTSIMYNAGYKSIYDRKLSNKRKERRGKKQNGRLKLSSRDLKLSSVKDQKHRRRRRNNINMDTKQPETSDTFLTSLLDNTDDEENFTAISSSSQVGNICDQSILTKQAEQNQFYLKASAKKTSLGKKKKKRIVGNKDKMTKNKKPSSKFGQQSSTFLTASLFEPFDEDEFNHFDSPVLETGSDIQHGKSRNIPSYIKTIRHVKKAYIEEEEEEVVDASGGLTTGLSSMTRGYNTSSLGGKDTTRMMLGLSINSKTRNKKRHAWMSKSVLKQQDSNRHNMLMPFGKSHGSSAKVNSKLSRKTRQWSASRASGDNNTFHSYTNNSRGGGHRLSKKRHNHNKGILLGTGVVRRVSR